MHYHRQSRNDLESRPKPSAQLWHRLRTTGQEIRHRDDKTANFSLCSNPTELLVLFSTELSIPALANTPGAHCCGPALPHLPQGSSRSAMARGAAQTQHCTQCWEPWEEQALEILLHQPWACRQPAELPDSLSALLGFINSSLESAAKIGVGQLSADRAATRNQHLQRALLKQPSSLWKRSVRRIYGE